MYGIRISLTFENWRNSSNEKTGDIFIALKGNNSLFLNSLKWIENTEFKKCRIFSYETSYFQKNII